MDLALPIVIAVGLAGAPVAVSLAHATGRLHPIARMIDVRRPVLLLGAVIWSGGVPLLLAESAGEPWLIPGALFAWGGLAIALSDLSAMRAPTLIAAVLGVCGVGFAAVEGTAPALGAIFTAISCFALMHGARIAFRRARGIDGMGGGDPGAMAALGAWSGPLAAPWVLACASVLGLILVLVAPALRRPRARLAFAPLLVVAATLVAMFNAWRFDAPFWMLG